jgi:hypothetical protein
MAALCGLLWMGPDFLSSQGTSPLTLLSERDMLAWQGAGEMAREP